MEEMRILSVNSVRRSGTIVTRSASNVRAAGQPCGALILSPNNSIENQLTLSSVKRLPGPSASTTLSWSRRTPMR